jgi:sec-independent protein translocase protein TatB|tara:strand:- start:1048 stop:1287 length:240 start_codon:yes stop_codon:yes gene_type:complete
MPQIGWFEILVIVVLAILIIGPKDFPIILRKIGGWIGSMKSYFAEIQKDMLNVKNIVDEEDISLEEEYSNNTQDKKKDE